MKPAFNFGELLSGRISMMYYPKYFVEGQDVLLRRINLTPGASQWDSLSGKLMQCSETSFDVELPYGDDETERYPFLPGMPFQVLSDYMGLGLSFTGTFEDYIKTDSIRLQPEGDLEFYFQRQHQRTRLSLWVGYQRSTRSLRSLRQAWKRNVEALSTSGHTSELPPVMRQSISLGGGGLQLYLPAPVAIPELFLVFFDLGDKGPMICVLCETVWVDPPDENRGQKTGLKFLNILDSDRNRIIRLVRQTLRYEE